MGITDELRGSTLVEASSGSTLVEASSPRGALSGAALSVLQKYHFSGSQVTRLLRTSGQPREYLQLPPGTWGWGVTSGAIVAT